MRYAPVRRPTGARSDIALTQGNACKICLICRTAQTCAHELCAINEVDQKKNAPQKGRVHCKRAGHAASPHVTCQRRRRCRIACACHRRRRHRPHLRARHLLHTVKTASLLISKVIITYNCCTRGVLVGGHVSRRLWCIGGGVGGAQRCREHGQRALRLATCRVASRGKCQVHDCEFTSQISVRAADTVSRCLHRSGSAVTVSKQLHAVWAVMAVRWCIHVPCMSSQHKCTRMAVSFSCDTQRHAHT